MRTTFQVGFLGLQTNGDFWCTKKVLEIPSCINKCFFGLRKQMQTWHLSRPNNHPPGPAVWQRNMGVDQKGGEPASRFQNKRYNFELERKFGSSDVINVKIRLCYVGDMIRRPDDLLQKSVFLARPQGTRRQGRPKSRWADGRMG
jgi:hypothetical protein